MADVVPLTGENRMIVAHGLRGLDTVRNPGLRALLDVAGFTVDTAPPNARQVAFQLAPRINAAGRMDTAKAVVELFLTNDAARARDLAQQLHDQNTERQQVEAEIRETCEQIVGGRRANARWCTTRENWHRGVLGIVASRLVERLHRPVVRAGAQSGRWPGVGLGPQHPGVSPAGRAGIDAGAVRAIRRPRARRRRDHGGGAMWTSSAAASMRTPPRVCARTIFCGAWRSTRCWNCARSTSRRIEELFTLAPFGHGNPPPLFAALGRGGGGAARHHEGEAPQAHGAAEWADAWC